MDQQLASIAPYVPAGWHWAGNAGYYVHRGTVYLVGDFGNTPGTGGPTILSGLPSSICPVADTSVSVMYDWTNGSLALTTPPFSFAATMHTDGTLSFDSNPVAANPSAYLYFNVGMVSWPTSDAITDTITWTDLGAHVNDPYYAPNTGQYSIHDARFHLRGSVTNISDPTGGHAMLLLPPTWMPRVINDFVSSEDIGTQATQFPDSVGDMLVINIAGVGLFINHNGTMASGDNIDLTGVGWPLEYSPVPPPAFAVGQPLVGVIRRGWSRDF